MSYLSHERLFKQGIAFAAFVSLVLLCPGLAHACYTGLTVIPTADVVAPEGYGMEIQCDGSFAKADSDTRVLNTEFGLMQRFEGGADIDLHERSSSRAVLNAKYVLVPARKSNAAVAVGICNVGQNVRSSPYVVATLGFAAFRAHLGTVEIAGNRRWFVGADRAVSRKLTLVADYTSGPENFASAGFSYQFDPRFGLMVGAEIPNAGGNDPRFTIHFVMSGSYGPTGMGH